ncbi:MAG TPA: MdtA/MuxA family multidrug efflux RND transporter periplasmic adaptor subunit [Bryobacteraceae bacterium]|nr:MdtA/MuxA family multidrug efflux RND transporter periplasmic adaptor subunit [Bryobacteraceae bacterium]
MTTNTTTTDLKNAPGEHILPSGLPHRHPEPPVAPKPRKRGFLWVVLLLAVVAVAGYAVWRAGQPGLVAQPQGGGRGRGRGRGAFGPTPVSVQKATRMNVPVYLTGLGNVSAFYTVTVKSRVDGQLMAVDFKEGDFVKQGQELAVIDPRPFQVQLEQAEGTLARDQALLANARVDLERYKTLLAQDAIPKQQLDTQNATVGQYEGNVKTDQANIDNAKLQITYAHIIAPISGRIGLRLVDPGNIVHASDANGLLVITQLQPISVFFTIPEDSLPQVMNKLRAGARLPVDAFNRDNSAKLSSGYLLTVDNQIDPTTGTSKMKAVFDNKDNVLFPNQFVNMRLLVNTKPNQIVIPSVAIQHGQQGPFVFLVDDDSKVKIQPVQPDIVLENNMTSIASGLSEGDPVVVDGTDRLQDGSQVRIRRPGDDGSGAPEGGARRGGGRNRKGGQKGGQ